LTAAGLISRLLGAGYRLPLASFLGDEGIGLYQMAYPIYTTILSLSTAGIPVAISKLVAEKMADGDKPGAYRVFRISLFILTVVGLVSSIALLLGAHYLAQHILRDPRAYYAVVGVAPAIFIVSVMSAFRGFFQGFQTMLPTAVSQVIEQIVRVATVFGLAIYLLPRGIEYAAGGATFGAVTGALASLFFLLIVYWPWRRWFARLPGRTVPAAEESSGQIIYRIVTLAVPISLGALVLPLMQTLDTVIVPSRLQIAGFNVNDATALFGQLTGMATPLINLPSILTVALATSLVPAISEALALRNYQAAQRRTYTGIRITLLLFLPAMAGLYLLADEICFMLYKNAAAGIPLAILAIGGVFLGLQQTTSGILQGTGRTILPVRNLLVGAVGKVIVSYVLTGIPSLGIRGAAIGTVTGFLLASSLNLYEAKRHIRFTADWREMLLRPLLAVGSMALAVRPVYGVFFELAGAYGFSLRLQVAAAVLPAIAVSALVYGVALLLVGGVTSEDLALFGTGQGRIWDLLRRIGLLRR